MRVETSDYLPFGKRWELTGEQAAQTITDPTNRWRFSGKETQSFYNPAIPYNDFGARLHDPRTGRWLAVDPMAEKYYSLSAFGYCAENPVLAIDPDGRVVIPALIIVGKAVVGAGLDAAAQFAANKLSGQSNIEALKNIDATSAVKSGAISALGVPGASTVSKTLKYGSAALKATIIAADAAVDYSANGGLKTVGKDKTEKDAIVDLISSSISSSSQKVSGTLKKRSSEDITKGSFSTLKKADKAKAYKINEVVHSDAFTFTVESTIESSSTIIGKTQNNENKEKP